MAKHLAAWTAMATSLITESGWPWANETMVAMRRSFFTRRNLTLIGLAVVMAGTILHVEELGGMTVRDLGVQEQQNPSPFDKAVGQSSAFDKIAERAFSSVAVKLEEAPSTKLRRDFVVSNWTDKTNGGLMDEDRELLGKIYRNASAVFEYGLGESTYIANYVGVQHYAGVDSDPVWVAQAREKVAKHFRFYLADIGTTKAWGYPTITLEKSEYQYQVAPLLSEPKPFDVYMVDGRWRLPCTLVSFLHASARGANPSDTIVLLHDCEIKGRTKPKFANKRRRPIYRKADKLFDLVNHSGAYLCTYKRKPTTTDQDILDLWLEHYKNVV